MNYSNLLPLEMVGKYFSGHISAHEKLMTQVITAEPHGGGFLLTHNLNGHLKKTALSVFRLRFPYLYEQLSSDTSVNAVTLKPLSDRVYSTENP